MPKRIYQVGEPCDTCKSPTIRGKDGNGYCWPCWSKWKDAQKATQAPPQPQTQQTGNMSLESQSEHSVALKAYLQQLETRIRVIEDWKDKQPVYADIDGKMEIVPNCFDGEIKPEDLP